MSPSISWLDSFVTNYEKQQIEHPASEWIERLSTEPKRWKEAEKRRKGRRAV